MTPIREHAQNLIAAQADEGLRNLRRLLESAKASGNTALIAHYERRINERRRFLDRSLLLLMCEREGHDWIKNQRGEYCRRCRLPKELSK